MDLTSITKAEIDEMRQDLRAAKPYTEEEIVNGIKEGEGDPKRRLAMYAKLALEQLGLSLTDPNDYGNITK